MTGFLIAKTLTYFIAHCLISLLPRFSSVTANDVRTECKNANATRPRPAR